MHEIEPAAVAKGFEKSHGQCRLLVAGRQGLEGQKGIERERRVVEIGPAAAIAEATTGRRERLEKRHDEFGRLAERPPGEAGHLQHLQSLAHAVAAVLAAADCGSAPFSRATFASCSRQ